MSYMPARSEISDGETVVGGPSFNHSAKPKGGSIKETTETIPHGTIVHGLTANADYFTEDRPYLIKIGEGNLPAALQKLDEQLKSVRTATVLRFRYMLMFFRCHCRGRRARSYRGRVRPTGSAGRSILVKSA